MSGELARPQESRGGCDLAHEGVQKTFAPKELSHFPIELSTPNYRESKTHLCGNTVKRINACRRDSKSALSVPTSFCVFMMLAATRAVDTESFDTVAADCRNIAALSLLGKSAQAWALVDSFSIFAVYAAAAAAAATAISNFAPSLLSLQAFDAIKS